MLKGTFSAVCSREETDPSPKDAGCPAPTASPARHKSIPGPGFCPESCSPRCSAALGWTWEEKASASSASGAGGEQPTSPKVALAGKLGPGLCAVLRAHLAAHSSPGALGAF